MMLIVPLQPVPSQALSVLLNSQQCQINVVQKTTGVFLDLYVNDALIVGGVIARDADLMVRSSYLGFIGDLAFLDTQPTPPVGATDPVYTGLGTRYVLAYFTPAELPLGLQ